MPGACSTPFPRLPLLSGAAWCDESRENLNGPIGAECGQLDQSELSIIVRVDRDVTSGQRELSRIMQQSDPSQVQLKQ